MITISEQLKRKPSIYKDISHINGGKGMVLPGRTGVGSAESRV